MVRFAFAPALAVVVLGLCGCPGDRDPIECIDDTSCGLAVGGHCLVNPATGNQFCAYPDGECPDGMRWSDFDVEPSISGTCVASGGPDAGMPDAPEAGCVERIAFRGARSGDLEIYSVRPDGTGLLNLTQNAAQDAEPTWSPDGSMIAFVSDRDGEFDIHVMNADGTGDRNLTPGGNIDDAAPRWSPDGRRLAFQRFVDNSWEIYTVVVAGGLPTRLTTATGPDERPRWSPDGQRILFISSRTGNQEVFVMDDTGATQANLTNNPAAEWWAEWAPSGSRSCSPRTAPAATRTSGP